MTDTLLDFAIAREIKQLLDEADQLEQEAQEIEEEVSNTLDALLKELDEAEIASRSRSDTSTATAAAKASMFWDLPEANDD